MSAHDSIADDAPEVWGDGCECWVAPKRMWFTHYGAVEPGSQLEFNPECPKHGDQPQHEPSTWRRCDD